MAADEGAKEENKAKMREALERKKRGRKGVKQGKPVREKAHHESEVIDNAPHRHLRKAGGGGA